MTGQALANVLGVAGFGLGVLTLWFTRRDSVWRRRHTVMESLREPLVELEAPVVNAHDPQQVRALYSVATGAHLEVLEASVDRVSDRRFRNWLRAFVAAVAAVRAAQQPTNPDGSPGAMPPTQMRKLEAARRDLEKMLRRLDEAVRRGAGGN